MKLRRMWRIKMIGGGGWAGEQPRYRLQQEKNQQLNNQHTMTQMFCAKKSIALSRINTVFYRGLRVYMYSVKMLPNMEHKKIYSWLSLSNKIKKEEFISLIKFQIMYNNRKDTWQINNEQTHHWYIHRVPFLCKNGCKIHENQISAQTHTFSMKSMNTTFTKHNLRSLFHRFCYVSVH